MKTIKIYGTEVPVKKFIPEDGMEHIMGYCNKDPLEIYINADLNKKQAYNTLCHELVHAVVFKLGFDQVIDHSTHELLAENLGTFISENFKML